jgi:hypothetical protein
LLRASATRVAASATTNSPLGEWRAAADVAVSLRLMRRAFSDIASATQHADLRTRFLERARRVALAATPTFAIMALMTGVLGGGPTPPLFPKSLTKTSNLRKKHR